MAPRLAQPPFDLHPMNKDEIIGVFENIARLLELKGENPFKIRAYLHASKALETLAEPLEKLISEERLVAVDGIGTLTVRAPGEVSANHGDRIRLAPAGKIHRFDANGLAL